jgi:hypothetical protein
MIAPCEFHSVAVKELPQGHAILGGLSYERSGFATVITTPGERTSPAETHAIGLRGYNTAVIGQPEQVEPEILDLAWVQAQWPHRNYGISLVKGLIEHGKEEGFTLARASLRNQKAIFVIEKLEALEIIKSLVLAPYKQSDHETPKSTQQLLSEATRITFEEARSLYATWETENPDKTHADGYSGMSIDTVIQL